METAQSLQPRIHKCIHFEFPLPYCKNIKHIKNYHNSIKLKINQESQYYSNKASKIRYILHQLKFTQRIVSIEFFKEENTQEYHTKKNSQLSIKLIHLLKRIKKLRQINQLQLPLTNTFTKAFINGLSKIKSISSLQIDIEEYNKNQSQLLHNLFLRKNIICLTIILKPDFHQEFENIKQDLASQLKKIKSLTELSVYYKNNDYFTLLPSLSHLNSIKIMTLIYYGKLEDIHLDSINSYSFQKVRKLDLVLIQYEYKSSLIFLKRFPFLTDLRLEFKHTISETESNFSQIGTLIPWKLNSLTLDIDLTEVSLIQFFSDLCNVKVKKELNLICPWLIFSKQAFYFVTNQKKLGKLSIDFGEIETILLLNLMKKATKRKRLKEVTIRAHQQEYSQEFISQLDSYLVRSQSIKTFSFKLGNSKLQYKQICAIFNALYQKLQELKILELTMAFENLDEIKPILAYIAKNSRPKLKLLLMVILGSNVQLQNFKEEQFKQYQKLFWDINLVLKN